MQEPDLFTTYVAFDPSLWWNDGKLVPEAANRLPAYAGLPKMLYVAFSRDALGAPSTRHFRTALRHAAKSHVGGHYQALPAETHATIYHPAALQALRTVLKLPSAPGRPAR